ncbi:PIN domain-containing protein [Xylophilus rhododendri]|uniref:Ribonuclease VapC n=1 Tax=Xylophilus rhododendri TaxID=2697032 RepID=A0A857J2N8_9BURK|nr:type II toxin-antitoxin system VapC family toxin [Xylophilus rhododendri]QHI97389.1 PIN domain-containing protein [Xylophilus rhododendri]
MSLVHIDTSVLAKRYLHEPGSGEVDAMLAREDLRFGISDLVLVEMESIVARRRREPGGSAIDAAAIRLRLDGDLRTGFFHIVTLNASVLAEAQRLIAEASGGLSTLDSLHLASACTSGANILATDDRQLGRAARAVGLDVISFI